MYRELLLGCGTWKEKRFRGMVPADWQNLTTLDYSPDAQPDVEWDLRRPEPLPFPDNTFDEVHAYHVLEHIGTQGDFETFFRQFSDYWRVLKPDGFMCCQVPQGRVWTWGDPGHTREINQGSLVFLNQGEYVKQVDIEETKTGMTDYRRWYKADFVLVFADGASDPEGFMFVLQAVKPSRVRA